MKPIEKKPKNLGIRASVDRWRLLNRLALDRDTSVQALVDEAIERWLSGEIPDAGGEQKMNSSTEGPEFRNKSGTFSQTDAPIDRKIVENVTENLSSERNPIVEIPIRREDFARIEATLKTLIDTQREQSRRVGELAAALKGSQKATKPANRNRRLDSRGKRKHPPGAQSGG